MKKIFALLLAVMMMFASISAVAETAEMNWDEIAEQVEAAGFEGEFVEIEALGLMLCIPTDLESVELAEEDIEEGVVAVFCNEDESTMIEIDCYDGEGMTMDDYLAALAEEEIEVEVAVINGITMATFEFEEEDGEGTVLVVGFVTDDGYVIEIYFGSTEEGFKKTAGFITLSIQPIA